MKSRNILLFALLLGLMMCLFAGCSDANQDKGYKDIADLYTLTKNNDNTYSYIFTDLNGKVLFEKQNATKEPHITQIAPTVYEISSQAGTGLSTNWAVFCDVDKSLLSETFYYVLTAKDDYVVCADYEDGEHLIIVQSTFDKGRYYKEYKLKNVSPVAADFVVDYKIEDNKCIVTYLNGENYTETEFTIELP